MKVSIRIKLLLSISFGCVLLLCQTLITSIFISKQQVHVTALADAAKGRLFVDFLRDSILEISDRADKISKVDNKKDGLDALGVYFDDVILKLKQIDNKIEKGEIKIELDVKIKTLIQQLEDGKKLFEESILDESMNDEDLSDVSAWLNVPLSEIVSVLNKINHEFIDQINTAMIEEQKNKNKPIMYGFIIFFISIIVLFLFAWFFSADMLKTINRILTKAKKVSIGDLKDLTERRKSKNDDELIQLDHSIFDMTASLRELVVQIHNSSNELVLAGNVLSDISKNSLERVNEQNEHVAGIKHSISQISQSSKNISDISQETVKTSEKVTAESKQNFDVIKSMSNSMKSLAQETENIEDFIVTFEKRVSDINSILTVINGISEQTNLLALNASIEAARAGEQGRGFAVVADEVRALAQRTQASSEDIKTIIQDVGNGVKNIVDASRDVRHKTLETSLIAKQSAETVKSAIDFIYGLEKENIHIATSISHQNLLIDEVVMLLDKAMQNEVQALDACNMTSEQSQYIAKLSNDLRIHVDKFTV